MKVDLRALIRRTRSTRRTRIVIRDIIPPATLATNLYRASYAPVIAIWTRAAEGIAAEYARSLAELTTDSTADLQSAIDAAAAEFDRVFVELTAALREWLVQTERWQRGKWGGAVLSATGVDLGTLLGPEDMRQTLDEALAWNTSLIRDVSDQARKRMADVVFAGLRERRPARDVAAGLREVVGMSRRRSIGIASDQLSKLTSSLADERRREAGIDRWRWRHSGKIHARAQHVARDGKIYADTADGADLAKGVLPPPDDRPSQLPYCGCRAQAWIDLSDD